MRSYRGTWNVERESWKVIEHNSPAMYHVSRATILACAAALSMLTGCTSDWDMQMVDPKDYYTLHPIENKLDAHNESFVVHFQPQEKRLSPPAMDNLRAELKHIAPLSADAITVQLSDADMRNADRKTHITKLMRSLGYTKDMTFEPSATVARDDMQIDIAYVTVVSPNCPDWRRSPVTTYSNTSQGNFRCANATNLGLMVADPHDLVRGPSSVTPDSERSSKVVQDYHAGTQPLTPSSGGASSTTSTSSSGAAAQ